MESSSQTEPEAAPVVPPQAVSHGAYVLADRTFNSHFSAFIRHGIASPQVNRFSQCTSVGTALKLVPGRDDDRLGLGYARAVNGHTYAKLIEDSGQRSTHAEEAYELTYRIEAAKGLAIQPDLQRIIHPDTNIELPAITTASIRIELSF